MPDLFAAQDRVIHNAMTAHSTARLARQVAHAAASFEHRLLGRSPGSIMVATAAGCLTVCIHEPLAPVERRLAHDGEGAARVRSIHRGLFDDALNARVDEGRRRTGVTLCGAIAHVDTTTGSIVKTLTTGPHVDLFLLGPGLPSLGVPIDAHVRAADMTCHRCGRRATRPRGDARHTANGFPASGGIGAVRVRVQSEGTANHEEDEPCWS